MNRTDRDDNLGYFSQWPAPMFEAMCKITPAEQMNATTTFYGPLFYFLARALNSANIMEIGNDQGWCSGFLAHAVKDNNARYGNKGRFYGIDRGDKSHLQTEFDKQGLPATFIQDENGSVHWLENQTIIAKESLDLVFVDGLHQNEYVMREVELLYPLIKSKGVGFICLHDVYSTCEEAFDLIVNNPQYKFEYVRLPLNYGFGILRKMEEYSNAKQWPDGDETALGVQLGLCNADGSLK